MTTYPAAMPLPNTESQSTVQLFMGVTLHSVFMFQVHSYLVPLRPNYSLPQFMEVEGMIVDVVMALAQL